uniref:[histone H3]-trimethyl-L-lysine(4) demethylase n=1 Tax=Macrostomum lignano TaxID=282301 RepID=A0A1I8HHV5_9PLAT
VDSAQLQPPVQLSGNGAAPPATAPFKPPPLAPIFEPTVEEFQDFYGYLESIAPVVVHTGICKIRPPKDWNPPFGLDVATFRFKPRVQRLNELEAESRVKLNFLDQLTKFWDLQGVRLRVPNVDRRHLDLHRLYNVVRQLGGYQEVTSSKLWSKVAGAMGHKQAGKSLASQLKFHYQKILLPFDLLKSNSQAAKTAAPPAPAVKTVERQASAPLSDAEAGRCQRNGRALRQAAAAADDARRMQLWSSPIKRPPSPQPATTPSSTSSTTTTATKSTARAKRSNSGVGGGWLNSLLCRECRRGDQESVLLICEGCEAPYHTFCLYPPLPDVPPGDWRCPRCVSETIASAPRPAEYGFEQSRTEYSLADFGAMADEFKRNYFAAQESFSNNASGGGSSQVPLDQVEAEFWRLLQSLSESVSVEYGADIHSSVCGSGFPTRGCAIPATLSGGKPTSKLAAEWRAHSEHPWNLNNLPLGDSGLLRFLRQDINGMVIPWCYVGMLFSAFCWHIEDHWSYSINYLHWGDPKTWYGVPSASAPALETAMREEAGELFERSPDLLHHITTIMNPAKLMAKGVPVYRIDQEAGDFVITFPRAYHAGFNQGFNFAEAVNFCSPSWLPMGRECVEKYIEVRRPCVFSHEELVCNMAAEIDELTADQAEFLLDEIKELQPRLADLTKTVASVGIEASQREKFECLPDDDRQCSVCNTTLYICGVQCTCQRRRLVCARHPDELLCDGKDCRRKPQCHRLVYRHTEEELLAMTQAVSNRCDQLADWRRQADSILAQGADKDLPDRSVLESLERQAVQLRVSQSCARLRRLRGALRMADRAAGVLRLLLRAPDPGAGASGRISESAFRALDAKLRELPCRLAEGVEFEQLRDRVESWRSRARQVLANPAASCDSVSGLLSEADSSLPVAMDDAAALSALGRYLDWKAEARAALGVHGRDGDEAEGKQDQRPSLADLQRLVDEAAANADADSAAADDVEFVDLSAKVTSLHHQASRLSMSIRECLEPDRQPQPDAAELARLVEAGRDLRVRLEPLQRLSDLLIAAADWECRADGLLTADLKDSDRRPSLEELEKLAADGRSLGLKLERLPQLEALIGQANAWLERASRNFLKKQSPHSLLQVLLPRSADSFLGGPSEQQPLQQHKKAVLSSSGSSKSASATAFEDPSVRFSAEQTDADRVAAYRDLASRELQAALVARRRNDAAGGCYCGRQLAGGACFLQCELCRLWLHAACAPLPKYLKPLGTSGPTLRAALRELKYLCPACERGRRPRMENLLSLLLVLQPLPVQLTAGAALQCLTERAMAWQSRVHSTLLGCAELRSALVAVVKAMRIQLPDRLNRQLGEDAVAASSSMPSSSAAASLNDDIENGAALADKKPRRKSPLFPRGSSSAFASGASGGSGGGPSMADSLRRPRLSLPSSARAKLEAMMLEGDLLERPEDDDNENENELNNEDSSTISDKEQIDESSASAASSAAKSKSKSSRVRIRRQRDSLAASQPPEKRQRGGGGPTSTRKSKPERQAGSRVDAGKEEEDEEAKCSAGVRCSQPTGGQVNWVQCDRCTEWYHWLCVGVRSDAELVGSYYCSRCLRRPAKSSQPQQQQSGKALKRGRKSSVASSGKA